MKSETDVIPEENWMNPPMVIKKVVEADSGKPSTAYLPKWKVTIAKWLNIPVEKRYLYKITCELEDASGLRLNDHVMLPNTDTYLVADISEGNIVQLYAINYSNQAIMEGGMRGVEFIVYSNTFPE